MFISHVLFHRLFTRAVYLDGRVSGKPAYITVNLVHVCGEFLACELFIDLTKAGVGNAAR